MSDYDYTANETGTATDNDDFEIRSYTPPSQTADQIEKENGFREVPPGEHVLVVGKVFINDPKSVKVMLDGQLASYISRTISVRLALPNDARASVSDGFTLPPEDPRDHRAYNEGKPLPKLDKNGKPIPPRRDKDGKEIEEKGGFAAGKFTHFLDRMGFLGPDGKITPAGMKPSGWIGRAIVAKVAAGKGTYTNKDGIEVPSNNQVVLFSYKPAKAGGMSTRVDGPAAGAATSSPNTPSPQAAQSRMAAVGMDDL